MRLKPRYYQQEAFDAAVAHMLKTDEPGILELATGAGKSIIIAMLADWLAAKNRRVLVLTDSSDLVQQNHAKYLMTGNDAGIFSAKLGKKQHRHQVIFAGIQSVARNLTKFDEAFSLVIVDECFHGDTKIKTEAGEFEISRLASMSALPRIYCVDESSGQLLLDPPVRCFQNGTKSVSLLKHSEGDLKCTNTHKFYTGSSWVPASEIKEGQTLYMLDSCSGFMQRLRRALVAVAKELLQSICRKQ